MVEAEMEVSVRTLPMEGHVGFDSLPDQVVSKACQKGFTFNILCVGETGIGKSTLIDSLFNTTFDSKPFSHDVPSVMLDSQTIDLCEKNVQMKLTVVDTVGYGDQVNKEDSFESIVDHIDQQFEAYLQEELRIDRCLGLYQDTRIHVCLYFISPTGHGLKSIDLECMKKLDSKVNIIPLIAKADAISKSELKQFKERIMKELAANKIKIYQFPVDDETIAETNKVMNGHLPFAVVGSREFCQVGNKLLRARQYPWGTVQVENETHCDTAKLREMLIRTNMEDLREQTHAYHYELYRRNRLENMGFADDSFNEENQPLSFHDACEARMLLYMKDLKREEEDMKQNFVLRVEEKESELKEYDRKIHEEFDQYRKKFSNEMESLEDYRRRLEAEIAEFNALKEQYESKLSPSKQPSGGFLNNSFSLGSLKGKKK